MRLPTKKAKLAKFGATVACALALVLSPLGSSSASATTAPEHAIVICQSASFYANYDSSSGPSGFLRTLYYGKKVGHTVGVHPVYNGWAATFDFGASQWGYMLYSCIGGYNSW
jgi:hypothetical protein